MAPKNKMRGARPVSEFVSAILDPALRKKTGISVGLLENWPEIAGPELGGSTRPERIIWPPRDAQGDSFRPGTLVLACDQSVVLKVQHLMGELLSRLNTFFGYAALARIRIIQKPVKPWRDTPAKPAAELSDAEQRHIDDLTQNIDDDQLRNSLKRLGRSIVGDRAS